MKFLFNPKSIALIGATERKGSVGLGIAKNLLLGKSKRKIFFVNPNSKKVLKQKTYASILDIKQKIDVATIAVPAKIVKQVCLECAQAKVKAVIIISSGFAEKGKGGKQEQEEIKKICQKNNILIIGPNCLGIINPWAKLNSSFSLSTPRVGHIALISQSGALINSVIDKSLLEGFGFSLLVSYGNEAGLSLNDFLMFASQDEKTKVIAIYCEEIKNGQEFIKIASQISLKKPIIVLKGGKTKEGKKAAESHTASLAGEAEVYSTAFSKANVIEVETIEDLFLASQFFSLQKLQRPERCKTYSARGAVSWAILTNGGAVGVMTADWCSRFGLKLIDVQDILGDADSAKYQASLNSLLEQKQISGVIFCQTLQNMTNPLQNAKIIIETQKRFKDKFILPLFLGGKITQKGVDILKKNNFLCFQDPRDVALCAKLLTLRQ